MYKYILCWRYLRTRYIALASIVSVTLGVATMIVVNSVMAGFSHKMFEQLHDVNSDISFEAYGLEGFPDPQWHMEQIQRVLGDDVQHMMPTVVVPAMLAFEHHDQWITRPVQLIGVDEASLANNKVLTSFLLHSENRRNFSFSLREDGYGDDPASVPADRCRQIPGGWKHRRAWAEYERVQQAAAAAATPRLPDGSPLDPPGSPLQPWQDDPAVPQDPATAGADPFAANAAPQKVFDPATEQHAGLVLAIGLGSYRDATGQDRFFVMPGDDVRVTFPTAGAPPRAVDYTFTVVDLWESKMSQFDGMYVFVPLEKLQTLRGMIDPQWNTRYVTSIQIRLKQGLNAEEARDRLRAVFAPEIYNLVTWRERDGMILEAVKLETAILNVLLFLIVAVAGFGILAIFFMIVVEKTRDIGILKSLGASRGGIMGIFLGYGLSLGVVGAGIGLGLGLLFVRYINEIADLLGKLTGRPVFDPSVYYFQSIPTIVDPFTVSWIMLGSLLIAVLASVWPAMRAAMLHPVEALRYE